MTDNLQSNGRVTNGDAVAHAQVVTELALQLLDQLSIVAEPPALEDAIDELVEGFTISHVGASDQKA
jgi:hypothetical protein